MMTRRAWSFGDDRQVSATAMITTRAMPALLPVHHRRVARTHVTLKDFADPLHSVVPPRRPAFGRDPPQIPQRYSDMDVRVSDHHPEGPGLVSGRFSRQPPGDPSAKECALWNGGLLRRLSS